MDIDQLERLLKFALLKERQQLWEEDWNSLTEFILLESNTPLSVSAITHHLEHTFSFGGNRNRLVKRCVDTLQESGRIIKGKRGQYVLSSQRRDDYNERIRKRDEIFGKFEGEVAKKMEAQGVGVSASERRALANASKRFLSTLLATQSLATLSQLARSRAAEHRSVIDAYVRASARQFRTKALSHAYISSMLILAEDTVFAAFFWGGLQNLVCLEIMRLDPLMNEFRELFLDDGIALIDTNFALPLLLPTEENHEVSKAACGEMQRLKIAALVADVTLAEIRSLWNDALLYMGTRTDPPKDTGNPFLVDFRTRRKQEQDLEWIDYSMPFRSEDAFANILRNKYGIQTFQVDWSEIHRTAKYRSYEELVSEAWEKLHGSKNKKRAEAVEHDASLLLLVDRERAQRKRKSSKGNYWFITFDLSLVLLSGTLQDAPGDSPLAVTGDSWLQTLAIFPASETSAHSSVGDIMIEVFASRWSRALPVVDEGVVLTMLDSFKSAPKDFNKLLQIAEDLVVQQRVSAPNGDRVRKVLKDEYESAREGLRGIRIKQLEEQIGEIERPPKLADLSLGHRIALTFTVVAFGVSGGFAIFTFGANVLRSPFLAAYVVDLAIVTSLVDVLWECKLTKSLKEAVRYIKNLF